MLARSADGASGPVIALERTTDLHPTYPFAGRVLKGRFGANPVERALAGERRQGADPRRAQVSVMPLVVDRKRSHFTRREEFRSAQRSDRLEFP